MKIPPPNDPELPAHSETSTVATMNALKIEDTLIVLDNITRVTFEENDTAITADNQCSLFFVGSGNDPLVVRGESARQVFDRISTALLHGD